MTNTIRRDLALRVQCFCTALVALGAAYRHGRDFARRFGSDHTAAAIWPLIVDGLLIIATVELWEGPAHQAGRWAAWLAFALGISLSLCANIAAALFKRYGTVLVLDSLDELPRSSRTRATAAIERFCADHPSITVLVTSRPDEKLQREGIAEFTAFWIAPFSDDEIRNFSRAWLADTGALGAAAFEPKASSTPWATNPLLLSWGSRTSSATDGCSRANWTSTRRPLN